MQGRNFKENTFFHYVDKLNSNVLKGIEIIIVGLFQFLHKNIKVKLICINLLSALQIGLNLFPHFLLFIHVLFSSFNTIYKRLSKQTK